VRARDDVEPLPPWLTWPIRVLAVVFVVPVRLAWDALSYVGRLVGRYILKPFAEYVLFPVLHYVVWIPLRWVTVTLLWRPLAWVAVHILAPVLAVLWEGLVWFVRALGPFWRLLGRVLLEVGRAVAFATKLLYRYLFHPLGIAIAWAWNHSVVLLWRYLFHPLGIAIAWAWSHSVVLLWRYLVAIPVAWAWRNVVVPPARWIRGAVLHPIAETTRRVLASLGLR
jgi:hypothetical protein